MSGAQTALPRYTLYSDSTPNPFKVHIALEELGVLYRTKHVDFSEEEQKAPRFLELNPNGKVPVLVDHQREDFVIVESGAILLYLAEAHGSLLPDDPKARSEAIQWLMWQMSGLGPMFGQLLVFAGPFANSQPKATERYEAETKRLFGVLNARLVGRRFIAGEHSVADIACMGWMWPVQRVGWDLADWPNLHAWHARCMERPAYMRGFAAAGSKSDEKRMDGFVKATVGLR
ncbi:MAG: glutathione S-transferase family protein [Myxococcota bacterium]